MQTSAFIEISNDHRAIRRDCRPGVLRIAALMLTVFSSAAQSRPLAYCLDRNLTSIVKEGPVGEPSPGGATTGLTFTHSVTCLELAEGDLTDPADRSLVVYNQLLSGSFILTSDCVEDPDGSPECTLEGTEYKILFEVVVPGTYTNYACIVSSTPDSDPSNDCTCIEISVAYGETGDCEPIVILVFSDGFESGDTSVWSSQVP